MKKKLLGIAAVAAALALAAFVLVGCEPIELSILSVFEQAIADS